MSLPFYGAGMRAWYSRLGGKSRLAKRLYSMFPPKNTYTTYVEPFFGAGWLFFEKDPSPKEVINDLDKDIYYALKDIQSITSNNIENMNFIPSKDTFNRLKSSKPTTVISRFYRFLYLKWSTFANNMTTYNATMAARMDTHKNTLLRRLAEIQDRLKGVTILSQDYKKIIMKYDSPNTFFYLDPPYLEVDLSEYQFKTINIDDLFNLLSNLKGKFMLSYNDHPTIRKIFQQFRIRSIETLYVVGGKTRYVKELIITNY